MMTQIKYALSFLYGAFVMGMAWWLWWVANYSTQGNQGIIIVPVISLMLIGFHVIGSVFVFLASHWHEK